MTTRRLILNLKTWGRVALHRDVHFKLFVPSIYNFTALGLFEGVEPVNWDRRYEIKMSDDAMLIAWLLSAFPFTLCYIPWPVQYIYTIELENLFDKCDVFEWIPPLKFIHLQDVLPECQLIDPMLKLHASTARSTLFPLTIMFNVFALSLLFYVRALHETQF